MTVPLVLFLPYPPTSNNLFPTGKSGKRFPSGEYKAWQAIAGLMLNSQRTWLVSGRVRVTYEFHRPDNRRRDVCNLEKGPSDLLVKHGIIEDDCLIWEATMRWVDDHPGQVKITITPFEPNPCLTK